MKQTKKYPAGFAVIDRRVNVYHPALKADPRFDGPTYSPGKVLAVFMHLAMNAKPETKIEKLSERAKSGVECKPKQGLTSYRTTLDALGFTKHTVESAFKRLVEMKWIGLEKCDKINGGSKYNGMRYTILYGLDFGFPTATPDTSSDDTNNTTTKGEGIPTRNECIAQLQQAVKNKAAYVDGICIDSIVDTFLAKIEGGSPYKSWKGGLVTFCRNQRKWDAEAAAKNTSYSPKIVAKPTRGKGPEALFEMDCKASKRNAA